MKYAILDSNKQLVNIKSFDDFDKANEKAISLKMKNSAFFSVVGIDDDGKYYELDQNGNVSGSVKYPTAAERKQAEQEKQTKREQTATNNERTASEQRANKEESAKKDGRRFDLWIDKDLYKQVVLLAIDKDVKITTIINNAIREYIAKEN